MGFQKLLLSIDLILITTTIFCVADNINTDERLPHDVKPLHYDIALTPYLEEGNFYGETNVTIEILRATTEISLHVQELEIYKTEIILTNHKGQTYKLVEHSYNYLSNIFTFYFNDDFYTGTYFLYMKFVGNFSEGGLLQNGFMKIPYTEKEENSMLAATFLKPNKARRVFPCWDEPAFKATFDISVKHHKKYTVLSNMPMREQVVEQNDMVWTHFKTTPVMSTYLVGIVISNFGHISNANINVWCRPSVISQTQFVMNIAKKISSDLVRYTNESSKVPKMDHVIVQDYPLYGMENWGLIIYNESNVIYDNSIHPTFRRKSIATLVAHQVIHQWFGNLVTPVWWNNVWLAEGFAVFFEAYFMNEFFEDWKPMDFLVTQRLYDSFAADLGIIDSVTQNLDNTYSYIYDNNFDYDFNTFDYIFTSEIYDKAPALLRMLYLTISDEVFRKGVIKYLTAYQFRPATPDDLWSAMQSALDESTIPNKNFKIKEVMDLWMNQNLYPVLNVTRNYETNEVKITQKCVRATDDREWWIPITFATESNPDFSKTVPERWLRPNQTRSSLKINLNNAQWIIFNVQQTAYCRVYYDATNWQLIARYLNSNEFTRIPVLNRAQIINDAFAFLMEDQIDKSIFFDLISYLSREEDLVAWHPMFRILTRLLDYFSLPESKDLKSRLIQIFDHLLKNIKYEEFSESDGDDDLTKLLRLHATKWICVLGHPECKRKAADKLNKYLADPDTHKIPQWWQEWTYCFGLAYANQTTWNKMLHIYEREPNNELGEMLSCVEDPSIIIRYLNIITSNTTLFNDERQRFVFKIILGKHARNDLILDYILENYDTLKPRSVTHDLIINIVWNVFSNEQIDKVERFSEIDFYNDPDMLSFISNEIKMRRNVLKQTINDFTRRFGTNRLK